MKKLTIVAATSVTALSMALVASPAYAVDFNGPDIDFGTQFYTGDWTGTTPSGYYGAYPDDWQAGPNANSFDEGMTVYGYDPAGNSWDQVACVDPADLVTASDGSGDQILTCDPYTLVTGDGEVSVTLEYRFYANFSFVRLRVSVTNLSGAPVTGALLDLFDDYYQDSSTYLSASNTLGLLTGAWPATTPDVLTDADLVYAFDDRTANESSPVVLTGRGLAGSAVLPQFDATLPSVTVAGNGEDYNSSLYHLPTLAAGQTVELALFHKSFTWGDTGNAYDVDTLAAVNAAWAEKGIFDSFSGPLTAGIADPSIVLNWSPAAAPALANTGSDASGTLLIAGILLMLGAAVAGGSRLRLARR